MREVKDGRTKGRVASEAGSSETRCAQDVQEGLGGGGVCKRDKQAPDLLGVNARALTVKVAEL